MNSDDKKSDDYWMGVRDALRMVDSFVRLRQKHPKRTKKLEDFIADGLVSAAKRCKTCLSRELGVAFKEDKEKLEDTMEISESSESDEIPVFFEESSLETTEPIASPEIPEAPPPESIEEEELPDPFEFIDSPPSHAEEVSRDFSSEFELVEPEPLITKPEEMDSEPPSDFEVTGPPELDVEEEELTDIPEDISEPIDITSVSEEEPETPMSIPRFSWDDRDDIETPSSLPEPEPEIPIPEEPKTATVRVWSPVDESATSEPITPPDSEYTSSEMEDDVDESELESSTEEPPAPPPPPESDESEEERKRRARRLFFGT